MQGAEIIDIAQDLNDNRKFDEAIKVIEEFNSDLEQKGYKDDELFVQMKETIATQKKMITNTRDGKRNAFKSKNFAKQAKNIYMNECSAPMFSKGLYQNKRQKKMSKRK